MLDKTTQAHADTGETGPCIGELPDFYKGTRWALDAVIAATTELNAAVKELSEMHNSRRAIPLKITAEGVERLSNQINVMAGVLKRKTTDHVNRRSGHE
jgi:HAMP domain-containing protein